MPLNRKTILIGAAALYGLVLFLTMTLWRLPADRWLGYLSQKVTQGRVVLRAERATPSLPLGYRFERVSYSISGAEVPVTGQFKALDIKVDFLNLLAAYLPVNFEAHLPSGGTIKGNAGVSVFRGLQKGFFEMEVSDIRVENLGIDSLLKRKIQGTLNGEMTLKGPLAEPTGISGQGHFVLRDGSVDTRMDLAGLKVVSFEAIRLPFSIKDGSMTISKAEMQGSMFSGSVSGQILLSKPLERSSLELIAKLKPGSQLEKNPLVGSFLSKMKRDGDRIVLKLGGILGRPSVAWGGN